jgi:hypothetical protein
VHLVSDNPLATADWYVRNLDARISDQGEVRGSMRVRLRLGDALLNIRSRRPGETIVAPQEGTLIGIDHMAFSVDEFEQMVANFEENGVRIIEPAFVAPSGGQALFIEGPDKVSIELLEILPS